MSEHDDDTCPHFVMRTLLESEKRYTEQVRVENARLKDEIEHWKEQWHFVIQDNNRQMDEVARLKAEVERLRKAWDAMADIDSCFDGYTPITQGVGSVFKIVKRWKDANKI